jgi:hypothetical protein
MTVTITMVMMTIVMVRRRGFRLNDGWFDVTNIRAE